MDNHKDSVGKLFLSGEGTIYRQLSYQSSPTVTLENVISKEQENHAVDCLNINSLKLTPFEELSQKKLVEISEILLKAVAAYEVKEREL